MASKLTAEERAQRAAQAAADKSALETAKRRIQLLEKIAQKSKDIAKTQEETGEYDAKANSELEKQEKNLAKIDKFLNGNNQKIKDGIDLYKESESSISSMSSMMGGLKNQLQKTTDFGIQFSKSIGNTAGINKATFEDSNSLLSNITSLTSELAQLNKEDAVEIASKSNELDSLYTKLNGNVIAMGAGYKNLNKEERLLYRGLKQQLKTTTESIVQASKFANISKETKELYEELGADLETIEKTFRKISTTASIFFSSFKNGLGVGLIYAGMLFDDFVKISKEIGGSIYQMSGFKAQAFAVSKILGDEAAKAVTSLADKLGDARKVSVGLGFEVGVMSNRLGTSGEETAELVNLFGNLSGQSSQFALNILEATSQLAIANGIAPAGVMKDIAQNTELFSTYARGGGENIAQAAIQAKRLGVGLDVAGKMADNLLDYQTSVQSEMEASVLLGRNINLNKARELAYADDIAGAQKAALEAVGGVAEFNKMDVFQKKAVADALGTSVGELKEMATNQDKALTSAGKLEGVFDSISAYGADLSGTIGGTALKGMGGLLVGAKDFKGQLSNAKEGFDFIKTSAKGLGGLLTGKGTAGFGGLLDSYEVKAIKNLKSAPISSDMMPDKKTPKVPKVPKTPKVPSTTGGGSIASSFGSAGQIAAIALVLIAFAAAIYILALAFEKFNNVTGEGFAAGIGAMAAFTGAIILLTPSLVTLSAVSGSLLPAIGIMLAFGTAITLVGLGINLAANGIATLVTSFKDLNFEKMSAGATSMLAFAVSLGILAGSLALLGTLGLPGLAVLSAAALAGGVIATIGGDLFGGNEPNTDTSTNTKESGYKELIQKIDALTTAIMGQPIQLSLDGNVIAKTVRKETSKSLGPK